MIYRIYCDGGARGNPGPGGIGFVIYDQEGRILIKAAKFVGQVTNNVAEYLGVIEALRWFKDELNISVGSKQPIEIKVFLDSLLVVNQLNGIFKIKNSNLRNLIIKVRELESVLSNRILYHHIPREKNKTADSLVNKVIDKNTPRFT